MVRGEAYRGLYRIFNRKIGETFKDIPYRVRLMIYNSILVIPDQHMPAMHVDMFKFIKAVAKLYKPDKVINLGDELDFHCLSFHPNEIEYDYTASQEFEEGQRYFSNFYEMFESMDIMHSNHGSMIYRKSKACEIPRRFLKSYNEVLDAPDTYVWHKNLVVETPRGPVNFSHGHYAPKNPMKKSQLRAMSQVQGHYHNDFSIEWWQADNGNRYFGMTCGCLIDDEKYAFLYNKTYIPRPQLGCAIIYDGVPELIPMYLDENKRWDGKL